MTGGERDQEGGGVDVDIGFRRERKVKSLDSQVGHDTGSQNPFRAGMGNSHAGDLAGQVFIPKTGPAERIRNTPLESGDAACVFRDAVAQFIGGMGRGTGQGGQFTCGHFPGT